MTSIDMPSRRRMLLINSTVAFCAAMMLITTLHELGHAVAALVLGLHPILYISDVKISPTSNINSIIVDIAGPTTSLFLGLVSLPLFRYCKGFWKIFILWFALLNAQNFFGYLMTGPFVRQGDIGDALSRAEAGLWTYILVFVCGVIGTYLLGRIATDGFLSMTDPNEADTASQLRALGLFSWLLGVALTLLISRRSDFTSSRGAFELMGTLTSGIFVVLVRHFMKRTNVIGTGIQLSWPIAGVAIVVLLACLWNYVLLRGITL